MNNNNLNKCFLCFEQTNQKCPHCGLIYYCSEEHKMLHRPEKLCFPFKIEARTNVGRVMVAVRDIQPLELILYDRTSAYGPKPANKPVCLQCLKTIPENQKYSCSTCCWLMCDVKCEKGRIHQKECEILSKSKEKFAKLDNCEKEKYYRAIAPLRLLLQRDSNPGFYKRFDLLMDHNEERKLDLEMWDLNVKYVNEFIRNDCQLKDKFNDEEINRVCGLFWTNAFSCHSDGGQAVFPSLSFCSHSCIANANHVVLPNMHLALQAKILIKKGDELFINYISALQSTLRRQAKLRDKWFFICHCSRCSDPTEKNSFISSLVCGKRNPLGDPCRGIVDCWNPLEENINEKYWICGVCPNRIEATEVLEMENQVAKELQTIEDRKNIDIFLEACEKYEQIFHRNHYLILYLKRHIVELAAGSGFNSFSVEKLKHIRQMTEEILEVLNIVEPGYNRDRGIYLRHLSEIRKIFCRKLFSQGLIGEEHFTRQVQECMILFEESQKCMSMLIKK